MKGLIHIYTGDGKGKSTAAIGLTLRCAGSNHDVIYTQFLKNGKSSEINILKTIPNIKLFFAEKNFGFLFNATDEVKAEAKIVYSKLLKTVVEAAIETKPQLLVLDEIIATYNHDLIDKNYLLDFLKNKPENLEIVMTGREPSEELIDLGDYVSNIQKIKHPFDKGIPARIGIEK